MGKIRRLVFLVAVTALLSDAGPASAQTVLVPGRLVSGGLDTPQAYYTAWMPAGESATIEVQSQMFDAYLVVLNPSRRLVGQNGGSGGAASLTWTAEDDGWYTVVVTSPGGAGRGEFRLVLILGGMSPVGFDPALGELLPGVPVEDTLTEAQLSGDPGGALYRFTGREGDAVSIRMTSNDFDAALILLDPNGNEIASNDDAGPSLDAEIVTRLPVTGTYSVVATTAFGWSTGRFTLEVRELPELYIAEGGLSEANAATGEGNYHEYVWRALHGAHAEIWLQAEFDAFLRVYDAFGALVAADDDSGGYFDARVSLESLEEGDYYVQVLSSLGAETGPYTLYLWTHASDGGPGSSGPLVPASGSSSPIFAEGWPVREPRLVQAGEMVEGRAVGRDDVHDFVVALPDHGGAFDAWLFAEIDLELYGDLDRRVGSHESALFGSERVGGYEHIRVEAPAGGTSLYLQVAPYDDPGEGASYWLLVQEAGEGEPRPRWDAVPGEPAKLPLAGEIRPGMRYGGTIDGERFETQLWILEVPEGVERVHVGLFNADADLDLSIAPGWYPSPWGVEHDAFSITVKQNERMSIGDPGDLIAETTAGVYTIAVWAATPGETSYEIEVAFDEPLPPSSQYLPLDPGVYAALNPIQKAQVATVQVENSRSAGSGTILTPDGLILTNYHVVAECEVTSSVTMGCRGNASSDRPDVEEQIVSLADGTKGYARQMFVAEVVRVLPEYDLALLEVVSDIDGNSMFDVSDLNLPTVPIDVREQGANLGDDVIALGYPSIARLGARTPLSLARGIVSGVTTYRDERVFLQIDARISKGNSGGALVRLSDGVVIGIPSDLVYSETGAEVQSFARPSSLIPDEWIELIASRGGRVIGE